MASVTDFNLTVHGQGGHAAQPHRSVDAIVTAAEIVQSLQTVISREIDPVTPAAITIGQIKGGIARNVIADEVKIVGTARALSDDVTKKIPKLIKKTVNGIAKTRGAKVDLEIVADYPVMVNDPEINRLLERNYKGFTGAKSVPKTKQVLGGEDFAYYLREIPGAMFRLGIKNKKLKADKPWHSPYFMVDDEALVIGTALLVTAVLDFLSGEG